MTKGETPLWRGDSYLQIGVPFLRGKNIKEGRINFEDLVFIDEVVHRRMKRSILNDDLLLLTMAGTLGDVAYFKKEFSESNINQDIAKIKLGPRISYEYAVAYFQTALAQSQINILSNGGTRSHLNFEQIKAFKVVVPPYEIQQRVARVLAEGYAKKDAKETEAQALLDSIDDYLTDQLGLITSTKIEQKTFTVNFRRVSGKRFDALAYYPNTTKGRGVQIITKSLRELACINQNKVRRPSDSESLVPYIGLPECDINDVREVVMRPYKEVKGRSIVKPDDILFARIEPSVFNKKYVLADDLKGHAFAYTSTEFYVVTPIHREVNRDYLYAMFFSSFVFAQVKGKTTGSSGRRRIDSTMFAELQIPLPGKRAVQEEIAFEVMRRRREARRLREEGTHELERAKEKIERIILGEQA